MKRRNFINNLAIGAVGTLGFPTIVPAHVLGGKDAPSNKINIGQIGCGRIARTHDLPGTWKFDKARIMAVCDLDRHRTEETKQLVEEYYTKKTGQSNYIDVKMYDDYREMLLNKDIDAVMISTPDFWHAQPAMEAALAGKDIYLQKPTSLTIHEGRQLANLIKKTGRILQVGTQQRSSSQFRIAAELVRNGRIGKLHTVKVGLPGDPSGPSAPAMPIPKGFNYDMWLGSTPNMPYTEIAVHPQKGYDRPGWLRMEQFGAGMITGTVDESLQLPVSSEERAARFGQMASIVSLTGDAGKALAYQLERKLFDNGHAATVLESQDSALMQAIKNAGLIGLCINSPAKLADAVFDCNQHTIDLKRYRIYNSIQESVLNRWLFSCR
jgi:hypothetical protein